MNGPSNVPPSDSGAAPADPAPSSGEGSDTALQAMIRKRRQQAEAPEAPIPEPPLPQG